MDKSAVPEIGSTLARSAQGEQVSANPLLWPGETLWRWWTTISTGSAEAPEPGGAAAVGLSIAVWLITILVGAALLRKAGRYAQQLVHAARYQLADRYENLRVGALMRLKRLDWRSNSVGMVQEEVPLDAIDLAVLDHGATLAPGFAISVTDLSAQLSTRPSLVERSLVKLHRHKLVDPLLGSTDGFGDYRLTDSGAWYVAAKRRSEAAQL